MNKQITILLCMLFIPLFISSCGTKYARHDRCVCEKEIAAVAQEPTKEEEFKKAFEEKAQEEEETFTIDFEKLAKQTLFDFDSSEISADAYENLDFIVKYLEENPNVKVKVAGHTDDIGTEEYNQGLSERRANAVAGYFVNKGVAKDRVSAAGYGKSQPKVDNATEEGRAQNRRTEFIFKK